ncbi:MAG: choline/carnitine O-acyltransferase [Oscillospiraceae bacterium]|nr:choline/carnitine O-acyltransferase [Oscillospiraceae bacterium]
MSVFDNDPSLPSLPVPDLGETCAVLKQTVNPLLTPEVREKTFAAIDRFSVEGEALQKLLTGRKNAMAHNESWLRQYWDDVTLAYRESLPVNMNYCFELDISALGDGALPKLISSVCARLTELRYETLPPETTKTGYFSMDTLRSLIYTRIPCASRDVLYNPPLTAPETVSVLCKGHCFIMTVVNEKGELLAPPAIAEALIEIRRLAEDSGEAPPVGALTAAGREEAADARALLQQSIVNRMSSESLEKTVFTVCLDDEPPTGETFGRTLIGGDCANRWFDKSLQIIATPGGKIGVNIEHAGCDAGIWIHLLGRAFGAVRAGDLPDGKGKTHIRAAERDISPKIAELLRDMKKTFESAVKSMTIGQRKITDASRELIKSKKCSPDAFAQLLYQTAYYKEKKCFRSVYESVSARAFYQGRTENFRPVTDESAAFVKALAEGKDGNDLLSEKFRAAEKAHLAGLERRQKALGPERHLTGLQLMYTMYANAPKGKNLIKPEIFEDEGYGILRHDAMSTSNITADCVDFFGFPPVVEEGLGIGYCTKADALHLLVTSYDKSGIPAERFLDNVGEAAAKIMKILG